jgi:hypothetical protein
VPTHASLTSFCSRAMNVLTLGQHDAAGNQVPAPSYTSHVGVALRGLAGDLPGRLEPVPAVLFGDGGEVELRPRAQVAAIEREAIEDVEDGLAAAPKQIVKPRASRTTISPSSTAGCFISASDPSRE